LERIARFFAARRKKCAQTFGIRPNTSLQNGNRPPNSAETGIQRLPRLSAKALFPPVKMLTSRT
jgi:hypothetical protein